MDEQYERHEVPGPIEEPVGRRWLHWEPPPIGEWYYTGSVSGPPSWTLHCPPMFLAHITREGKGFEARFRSSLNRKDVGDFWDLDAARYFQPGVLCACGEQATYLREGKPICDKCYDLRGNATEIGSARSWR